MRTYIDTNDSFLHFAHTFDYAISSDVNITGTALTTATPTPGSIILTNNDADGDGVADNFILAQAKDGKKNQPFGLTWEANETGSFIVFAIAEDSNGTRITSPSTIISVIEAVGEVPEIFLEKIDSPIQYFGEPITESVTAIASDLDGQVAEVQFLLMVNYLVPI